MFSNTIILTIVISLVVSLFISLIVTFLILRFFTNWDDDSLESIVANNVNAELKKYKESFKDEIEKELLSQMKAQLDISSKVNQLFSNKEEGEQSSIDQSISYKEKLQVFQKKSINGEKLKIKKVELNNISLNDVKPEGTVFTNLGVSDGRLVETSGSQPSYYHRWEYNGKYYYELYIDESKIKKAIFNRSAVIDPYCDKHPDSINPDESSIIETIEYGILNSDNSIIQKAIIKYSK